MNDLDQQAVYALSWNNLWSALFSQVELKSIYGENMYVRTFRIGQP